MLFHCVVQSFGLHFIFGPALLTAPGTQSSKPGSSFKFSCKSQTFTHAEGLAGDLSTPTEAVAVPCTPCLHQCPEIPQLMPPRHQSYTSTLKTLHNSITTFPAPCCLTASLSFASTSFMTARTSSLLAFPVSPLQSLF